MSNLFIALLVGLLSSTVALGAQTSLAQTTDAGAATSSPAAVLDSERLEKSLQGLSWEQFKAVVSSIPKLKADVDAYGPLGWQYVQANYKTYPWRKNIDKLHEDQKRRLANLIGEVREGSGQSN